MPYSDGETLKMKIRDIPDDGWRDGYGEDTYLDVGQYLVRCGINEDQVVLLLQRVYWATCNEFH